MRIIAVVNQKGGCGKTTTAINLAAVFARRARRTLLVDMDPQAHCAAGLGVPEGRIEQSIADALLAEAEEALDAAALTWEVSRNLDLIPSTMRLAGLEAPGGRLHEKPDKDRRLQRLLAALADGYDLCLIDCPPTIGLLTFNALRAAREALIPVETGFFALRGAAKQWNTIQQTISHLGRPITCHILPTLHNRRAENARTILAALNRQFAGQIVPVVIDEHEALREAASRGQPVIEYAPHSPARGNFEELADWLEEHPASRLPEIDVYAGVQRIAAAGAYPRASGAGTVECSTPHPTGLAAAPAAAPPPAPTASSRAAEMVHRVRNITGPPEAITEHAPAVEHSRHGGYEGTRATEEGTTGASTGRADRRGGSGLRPDATATAQRAVPQRAEGPAARAHGVHITAHGVRFVQPGDPGQCFTIVGDFNGFSETANPLHYDSRRGTHEAVIHIPPGRYHYRLCIDGRWQLDPYNPQQEVSGYGEPQSVLHVPEARKPMEPQMNADRI